MVSAVPSVIYWQGGGAERRLMTKADLIDALANKLGMGKTEAERAVNIVLDDIINALKQGERVNISGFGTFSVSARQARTGRNPKTGESIAISASRSAKFKPGKQLKDSLNTSEPIPQPSSPSPSE
jgi:DNA-binding protein HU-beta